MKSLMPAVLILGLLMMANVVEALSLYPVLPDRVATEFGASGEAGNWQSKQAFLLLHLGVALGIGLAVTPLLYVAVRFGPARLIDMPHKEYWLAPVRQQQSRWTVFVYVVWMMDLTLAFLATVFWQVGRANLSPPPSLGWGFWVCLAGFLAGTAVWVACFYRRFRKPAAPGELSRRKERERRS
jgi:uncharacterized membrane protein